MERAEDRFFVVLVVIVTIALGLIIQPFFGAVLWAVIAALLFEPVMDRISRKLGGRRSLAASFTLLLILFLVVVPALIVGLLMTQEVVTIYNQIASGHIDLPQIFDRFQSALPDWATKLLERYGLSDIDALRTRLTNIVAGSFQTLAARAFDISSSALGFILALSVMLYLAFFLVRDGQRLALRLEHSIPLRPKLRKPLLDKIATVIRATIKGTLAVAVLQGLIGGVTLALLGVGGALLWGVAMAFASLIPAIGSALIWAPVAIYLLVSGAVWKGIVLIICGTLVIGMVDNLVRPILVGRDTQMPDYMVFISTLGGIDLFGFNGIVVGPVIAALFMAVWDIFSKERERADAGETLETRDFDSA